MGIKNKLVNLSQLFRGITPTISGSKQSGRSKSGPAPFNSDRSLLDIIPLDHSLTDRWDREWLVYFLTEDPRPFFVSHQQLSIISTVQEKEPLDVYNTTLVSVDGVAGLSSLGALNIWVSSDHLIGKNILEIGCGPGFLGKQIGKIAASYLGIDYSKLALSIAHLTSPPNCLYYHLSDLSQITKHAGTVDTMVGRNFFIHQNYQNLRWLLELAYVLLKPGGLISADFYQGNPAIPQGVIHPARSDLDKDYPSCAFEFTIPELEQAARETGFSIESVKDNLDLQRRFVFFVKDG